MPSRLLFVSHEMTLSGAPIQFAYLAQWLRARGWSISVVTPEPGDLAEKLGGIEIIYEPQLLIDPTYGALRRLAPQFDAMLANTIVTWEGVQAAHLENVPVIWYIHETQLGRELMKIIHMIEPSLELADTVVTPTQTSARLYQPFRSRPIEVIPYAIPPVGLAPKKDSEQITFALIGTYEERKGQDLLLQALGRLDPQLCARAQFLLAGRRLHESFYTALCEATHQVDNVHLLGPMDHAAAMEVLAKTDVLVCPSRDETMPIVLLEAWSLGKPIICTRVGGIEEWVHDGTNGILLPPENVDALRDAIALLITNADLREKLGLAGRETFDWHFTLERYGKRFEGVLREVLARNTAPAA